MPRSIWFKALLLFVALWAPLSQAETGWQPIQETIRKVIKITASIRLYVWITVWWSYWFLIRRQLNRSRRWWCPLGRWKILRRTGAGTLP